MKKIILTVPSLIRGGVERIVSILSKELNKFFEIYVVINHAPIEYEINGKLVNLKTPTDSLLRKIKNTFHRVMKLKKLIKDISPDYFVSLMGNLQYILTLNPVIVSIHSDPDFMYFYNAFLFKTVYKFSNVRKIITVSKGIEKN
jgi:glycosyltransferase involved in cell wall biosynthesis